MHESARSVHEFAPPLEGIPAPVCALFSTVGYGTCVQLSKQVRLRLIDAVRPHVNVAACRQIVLLPPLILVFPLALEPGDHCRREVWRVLAEQGCENLLKIARRNPAQIESRQERVEALRAPRPFW